MGWQAENWVWLTMVGIIISAAWAAVLGTKVPGGGRLWTVWFWVSFTTMWAPLALGALSLGTKYQSFFGQAVERAVFIVPAGIGIAMYLRIYRRLITTRSQGVERSDDPNTHQGDSR